MTQYFQHLTFAQAIKTKRGVESLLGAALLTGVSASTLSHLEQGNPDKLPDLGSLLAICAWLERPVTDFVAESPNELPDDFAKVVKEKRQEVAALRFEARELELKALNLENRITRAIESHHQGSKFALGMLLYPNAK